MNLVEHLIEQARLRPDAPAIVETRDGLDRATSFAALERRSAQVAAKLRDSGLAPGQAVLILHPMSVELYAVLLGVFRLGGVAMFLDPAAGREHLERCCELQPPDALVASPKAHALRLFSAALRKVPRKFVIGPWLPGATSLRAAGRNAVIAGCEPCASEAPALLTFTSGSTGAPKAAVRTHGFLLAQHRVLAHHLQLAPGEVDLTTLPIFLLAHLASGVTSVIPDADLRSPGTVAAAPVLSQITRLGVTRVAASPAFFERLLAPAASGPDPLQGLRKIFTGGAPVFPRLLERLAQAAPHALVEAVYGSTEAEPIAHLPVSEMATEDRWTMRKGGGLLTGRPIPEIRLRILGDRWGRPIGPFTAGELERASLPPGQPGEVVVAGDHVLKTYLHGQGAAETKFSVEGEVWHRTGDAGKLDEQGRLWLLGRCAATVRDRRGELHPFAVECVAMEHPEVRRAAFVSLKDKRILAVEDESGWNETVATALSQELGWAGLDELRRVPHLPVDRRHNAKIDYPALRKLLQD